MSGRPLEVTADDPPADGLDWKSETEKNGEAFAPISLVFPTRSTVETDGINNESNYTGLIIIIIFFLLSF